MAKTEKELSRLSEQLEGQERKKKVIEGELITLERTSNETIEKIRNHKAEIERNIFVSMNKKVRIE